MFRISLNDTSSVSLCALFVRVWQCDCICRLYIPLVFTFRKVFTTWKLFQCAEGTSQYHIIKCLYLYCTFFVRSHVQRQNNWCYRFSYITRSFCGGIYLTYGVANCYVELWGKLTRLCFICVTAAVTNYTHKKKTKLAPIHISIRQSDIFMEPPDKKKVFILQ